MGTTPNYALPYPEPTDLVKDGAQAIEDLALAVDSAITAASQNAIINGNMMVAQRGASFTSTGSANNDDKYTLDRWYILTDGNDVIDVTQSTDAPTGSLNSIALDVETINKKFGIAQIIEQKNCIGLIGQTVTLSFQAKVSSTTKLDNVKAAIVAWSGTADTVTSDIVSAWEVEGTNPTLIANATYENTPANLNVTTSWATYSITATVDTASTKNIIAFIWSDVTDTTLGDFLYVTDVQLEYGSAATRFAMHGGGIENEISACRRYYEKSYTLGTAPGTATSDGLIENGNSTYSDSKVYYTVKFTVLKRSGSWTGTSYTSGGTSGSWSYYRNGASGTNTMTFGTPSDSGFVGNVNAGAAWVVALIGGHWVVDAEM